MSVASPHGLVSVSSIGSFSSVGYSSRPSYSSFTLSLLALQVQEYFKDKRGRKKKTPSRHRRRRQGVRSGGSK